MKDLSVSITHDDWLLLREKLLTEDENENAAVLLCGISETDHERRLLARSIRAVPPELYIKRLPFHLEVSPQFYNSVVDECLKSNVSPVLVHSHPSSSNAWYSASDDYGEGRLLPVLKELLPGSEPASLVMTPTDVTGRSFTGSAFVPLGHLKIRGLRSQTLTFSEGSQSSDPLDDQFDRQIRAFGEEGQRLLGRLKVGIVGVGGTGSIVAEQLVRSGVNDFVLVDPDVIEVSNVSRLFGATLDKTGLQKTDVVAQHLRELGGSLVNTIVDSAVRQSVLLALRDRDVIFGCVDNDLSRAVLNRFSHQYLIPLIDLGVRLDAREGSISAAAGRVTLAGSGMACLRCSHHLNPERIRAESLPSDERRLLAVEGYVMGVDAAAPSVVSINTTIAGLGVTTALNLFVGLTGASEVCDKLYDAKTGTVFTVTSVHERGCDICDPVEGVKALGDGQIVSAYD